MHNVSKEFGFAWIYAFLCLVLVAAAFMTGHYAGRPVEVLHNSVVVAPQDASALLKAWGKPDQSIPGQQINANLSGWTCAYYQAKKTIVCYA